MSRVIGDTARPVGVSLQVCVLLKIVTTKVPVVQTLGMLTLQN